MLTRVDLKKLILSHDVLDNWSNRKEGSLTGVPSSFLILIICYLISKIRLNNPSWKTSMGKTALALNFGRNIAVDHKLKVGFSV